HATAMPEYILKDCAAVDYVIPGEADLALLELIHALCSGGDQRSVSGIWYRDKSGTPQSSGPPKRLAVIQHLPRTACDLVPGRNYFLDNWTTGISMGRNMPIVASRGCPYQCTFCSSPTMWTTRYITRTAESVVDEIEWLSTEYGANSIDFQDL